MNSIRQNPKNNPRHKNWPFLLMLLASILLMAPFIVSATDRHVTLSGNDNNPGTASSPWRTIGKAASTAVAGDVVYIHSGTYYERLVVANSGTASNHIVFRNYNSDEVKLDGTNLSQATGGERVWYGTVDIFGKEYIDIIGLQIINSNRGNGILMQISKHILIQDCYVADSRTSGIGCLLSTSGLKCYDINIRNNELTRNIKPDGWMEVISLEGVDGFEISGNYMHDNLSGNPNNYFGGGGENIDMKFGTSNGTCFNNRIENSIRVGIYVEAWTADITNIEIYGNTISNTYSAITIGSEQGASVDNIKVYNNIIYDAVNGITIPNYNGYTKPQVVSNLSIYNNTIVDVASTPGWSGGIGINIDNKEVVNLKVYNNIVTGSEIGQILKNSNVPTGELDVDHNLIWVYKNGYSAGFKGTNAVEAEPQFVNRNGKDFRLTSSSPAINAGTNSLFPNKDYDGNSRPIGGTIDIGAFEFGGTPNPDPDPDPTPATEYQAENFSSQSGTSISTSQSGFTGTGFVDYGGNGSYVQWNNVPSGTVDLKFRYTNGTTGNRSCALIVNGNTIASNNMAGNGNWGSWQTITFSGVNLPNTSNTIRLQANSSAGGPNLDKMDVLGGSSTTIDITSLSIAPSSVSIAQGSTSTLSVSVSPSNATNTNVTWSSSNPSVATVNASGLVTAVSAGSATITATSVSNTNISDNSIVTVTGSPGGGSGFTQSSGSDGLVVMEAENYTSKQTGSSLSTCNYQEYNDSGASNGKYMMVPDGSCGQGSGNNGPHIDFDVNFVKSGTHYLWVRMIAEDANDDSCIPYYNATSKGNWYTGTTGGTWTWKKKTFTGVSTGNQTVSIYMREDGLKIDKLLLTTNDSYVPTGSESESPSARNTHQSLLEDASAIEISVYPNPAIEEMTLDLGSLENAHLRIFDLSGHEMLSKNLTSGKINIELPRGVYLLKVSALNKEYVKKLVFK